MSNKSICRSSRKKQINLEEPMNFYIVTPVYGEHVTFKVGITTNFAKRLHGIQNGNPDKLGISFLCLVTRHQAESFERYLKCVMLAPFTTGGGTEWFRLDNKSFSHLLSKCYQWLEEIGGQVPSAFLSYADIPSQEEHFHAEWEKHFDFANDAPMDLMFDFLSQQGLT